MSNRIYMEVRGSMSRFDPLTEAAVAATTEDGLTLEELAAVLKKHGLSIEHVVYDPTRIFPNTFYADPDRGCYVPIYLQRSYMAALDEVLQRLIQPGGVSQRLAEGNWRAYYFMDVPVPMLIYDFQRHYKDIPTDKVFEVWYAIYNRVDYSNGLWRKEALDYVFSHAPEPEHPDPDGDGLITLYRGMGELSTPPEQAISWSTHPGNALWFAYHSGRGTALAVARVKPEQVVAYYPGYHSENEVILRPGTEMELRYEEMIPSVETTVPTLLTPCLPEFCRYGVLAKSLGYKDSGNPFRIHGISHILRVLLLSLIYYYHSGDGLTAEDKQVLIYFSLLHDFGRTNEDVDDTHGDKAVERIRREGIRLKGVHLSKKDYHIAQMLIRHHCRDDQNGAAAIAAEPRLTAQDKGRAKRLYDICKDMDGLDRVRFNGLDYRLLRTPYARKLPLVAGGLLKEKLVAFLDSIPPGSQTS